MDPIPTAERFGELGPLGMLAFALVFAVASFARGYSGFGFAALLVTGGSLILSPARVVPLAMLIEVLASIIQLRGVWADVDKKRLVLLLAGSAVGTPPGVWALAWLDADATRLVLSSYVLAMSGLMLAGWRLSRPVGAVGTLLLGIACGFVTGVAGIGGLIVVLFLTADGSEPALIRATMIAYFLPLDAYTAGLFALRGLYDADLVMTGIICFPILLAGIAIGRRSFLVTTPTAFRRYTLVLLMALALAGVARVLLFP